MKEQGVGDYKGPAVEKKWETLKKRGLVNDEGAYLGTDTNFKASGSDVIDGVAEGHEDEVEDEELSDAKPETDAEMKDDDA